MELSENYVLQTKDVKHARVRVSEDGKVRVILPPSFSEEDIASLLSKKKRWIEKQLTFFKTKGKINLQRNQILLYGNRYAYYYDSTCGNKTIVDHDHLTIRSKGDLLDAEIQKNWMMSLAKKYLNSRIEELSGNLKFEYKKLYIRNQKTKWGNCSKEKNISFNWRLIKAPLFVIDYLIIHELVHTEIMNHTSRFWTMLKSHYPQYKEAVQWLDKYGNSL
jgi:predicted metal-dependent hydrolase